VDVHLRVYFPGVEEAPNDLTGTSNAKHGEAILYLLRCVRPRIRVCAHARWSRGSLCITIAKET
jgi:hypothetical protein